MFLRRIILAVALLCSSAASVVADTFLIMVEEKGCVWCLRWNEEISHIYPKSPEGQAAPLQRIDIRAAPPEDMTFARTLVFTPTFVLMVDGQEVSRMEGYPGEDFFWSLLAQMLANANIDVTG